MSWRPPRLDDTVAVVTGASRGVGKGVALALGDAGATVSVLAHELRKDGVAVVGAYPGITRTEAVVHAFASAGMEPPKETHPPEFVGRAVAHVAADPDVMSLSGTGALAASYAERYGFTDVDGRAIQVFEMPAESRLA